MDNQNANYQRRVEQEIKIFEGHASLHNHGPAFHYYASRVVAPLLASVFGRHNIHEIYAESIARAVARTGVELVYSVGCGDARQELQVLRAADKLGLPPFRINGIELAPAVAQRANALARAEGMHDRIHVVVHDLNDGLPGDDDVSAVMAHHVLHHIVSLETLFDFVADRLHPDGVFVTFDMIGRNGHMRWPEVRPALRHLWAMLPTEMRFDHVFQSSQPYFQDWDCSIEGFEGVRAQDILPLLANRFTVGRFAAWGGIGDFFVSPRFAPNFDPQRTLDRAFLDYTSDLESKCLFARLTTPASMAAEFMTRRGAHAANGADEARMRRALRLPAEEFEPIRVADFSSPWRVEPTGCSVLECGLYILGKDERVATTMRGGWSDIEEHGVYGLLDEQLLSFQTRESVDCVKLYGWNPLPSGRAQHLKVSVGECSISAGPFENGAHFTVVVKTKLPQSTWDIRINSKAYRLPEEDGGSDRRPLAWLLKAIEIGGVCS